MIYHLDDSSFITAFAKGLKPVLTVPDGAMVRIRTMDCYSNNLRADNDPRGEAPGPVNSCNPATGPIYIEGAQKGDTLRCEILDIECDEYATMRVRPGVGFMGDRVTEKTTRCIPVKGNFAHLAGVTVPVDPMIGVIGVAPEEGCWDTDTPYKHGGNMDNHDIVEGCTLYFPVHQDGALFGLGDLHGVMGDGEVCICGLEMPATVDVRVSVIKGVQEQWPVWEMDGRWATMCSAETLDEAAEAARYAMLDFLKPRVDMDVHELIMLLSLVGDTSVCQVVDPLLTVRFTLSQSIGDIKF